MAYSSSFLGPDRMKPLLALLLVSLTGCTNPTFSLSTTTVVLPPGYAVTEKGQTLLLFGSDLCPRDLFGESVAPADPQACIDLAKDREDILLRVVSPTGVVTREVWQVSHTTFPGPMGLPMDQTYLERPAHYQ